MIRQNTFRLLVFVAIQLSAASLLSALEITVYQVTGQYGTTTPELIRILDKAEEIYKREFGGRRVKINFKSIIQTTTTPTEYSTATALEAYYKYTNTIPRGLWLYVLPPLVEADGRRLVAGYAKRGCFKRVKGAGAVVFLQVKNDRGEPRENESAYVVAHEIAHKLNARHVESMTIMHEAPLPWVTQYGELPFDIASKRQIRRCVQ